MKKKPRKWDQVLDAALLEFQEKGFDNTTMNQIATRAEVSKRTLYKYFPNKTDLFRRAMSKDRHLLMEYPIDDLNLEKDIFPQLLYAASSFTLRFTDPTFVDLARLVVREAIQNETLIEKIIANPQNSAVLVDFFQSAQDAEKISSATHLAEEFHGYIKSRCLWPCVLSGNPLTQAEADDAANSTARLFEHRFD